MCIDSIYIASIVSFNVIILQTTDCTDMHAHPSTWSLMADFRFYPHCRLNYVISNSVNVDIPTYLLKELIVFSNKCPGLKDLNLKERNKHKKLSRSPNSILLSHPYVFMFSTIQKKFYSFPFIYNQKRHTLFRDLF